MPILGFLRRNLNNLEHAVSISNIRIIFTSNSWHRITSFFSAAQFPTPPITFRRFIFDMPRERWTVVPQGGYDPPRGYTSQRASKALNSTNSFTAEYGILQSCDRCRRVAIHIWEYSLCKSGGIYWDWTNDTLVNSQLLYHWANIPNLCGVNAASPLRLPSSQWLYRIYYGVHPFR